MPPTVSKQDPRVRPPIPPPSADPLADALPVGEIPHNWVNMILYGVNGIGKTTLACDFPKPLLLVSFEPGTTGGSQSVRNLAGVTFKAVDSKVLAVDICRRLERDSRSNWRRGKDGTWVALKDAEGRPSYTGEPFVTHILDSCTSLQDMVLKELMGCKDMPVQLNWGTVPEGYYQARSEIAKEVMQLYRNLEANTIYIALEKDHNAKTEDRKVLTRGLQLESFFSADLGQATVKWMRNACDYICQLYIAREVKRHPDKRVKGPDGKVVVRPGEEYETGRFVRRLRTLFHGNYDARMRSPDRTAVPEYIEEPTFDLIARVIRGERIAGGKYQ